MPSKQNAFMRFMAARRATASTTGRDAAREVVVGERFERMSAVATSLTVSQRLYPRDEVVTMFTDEQPSSSGFSSRELTDAMPQMVWSTRADGYHDYFNLQWYAFTGVTPGSTDGAGWNGMFHPDDRERAWATWRRSLASGEPYEIEYRLRHCTDGYRWTLGRALPIRCADGHIVRWIGTCTDINDRKLGEEQRELLTLEMGHRIKNLFSIVSALIGIESRDAETPNGLATSVQAKIAALAATHSLVSKPEPGFVRMREATLHGMLASIVEPYQDAGHRRILVGGDDQPVGSDAATALALVFHELATNAVKYGALSVQAGEVVLTSRIAGDRIRVDWRERGGPRVETVPTRSGFGTRLTEATLTKQLNGSVERQWHSDGLHVSIEIDRSRLSRDGR